MHIREHVQLSATVALIAAPWLKQEVVIPFAASILIDVDHYAWHAVTQRTLSLRAAMQYFGQADPPQLPQMRLLHSPLVLGLLLVLALRTQSRFLWLVLVGMLFHMSLDAFHVTQMGHLKKTLSRQAVYRCKACGQEYAALQLHTVHVARNMLDRYNPRHFVVLCPVCHEEAHSAVRGEK
ncbi:MAG: hypothetical protein ACYDER_19915 [Ktedonobacteraceae bacterium]